jgi:hypothetical protein
MTQNSTVSVGQWIGKLILASIPIIGLIMLIVWVAGDSTPKVIANWAKALLAFQAIGFFLVVISMMM